MAAEVEVTHSTTYLAHTTASAATGAGMLVGQATAPTLMDMVSKSGLAGFMAEAPAMAQA